MTTAEHQYTNPPTMPATSFRHVGYVVSDIRQAACIWSTAFGVGPFVLMERVAFDMVDYYDEPATYEHSVAFGLWGSTTVELMQFHGVVEPESLATKMATPSNRVNHIGYSVADIDVERLRLEALGAEMFLKARTGDVEGVVLWVPQLGHSVELLADTDFVRGFSDMLQTITDDWDGVELVKTLGR